MVPGVIIKQLGPLSYFIKLDDGHLWKRHVDHLKLVPSQLPVAVTDDDDISFKDDLEEEFPTADSSEETKSDSPATPVIPISPRYPRRNRNNENL